MDNRHNNVNTDSGIYPGAFGLWWIKKEDDVFYIYQSENTYNIFGHSDRNEARRVVFGESWHEIADRVAAEYPEHEEKISDVKRMFQDLVDGKCDNYVNQFPWFNKDGEFIWIENQLVVVDRDDSGEPSLISGSSIDVTDQVDVNKSLVHLKEVNRQLEAANKRAINLANILVWRIDYNIHPDGALYFANKLYQEKLGMTPNEDGYLVLEEFMNSGYPDKEGEESIKFLLDNFYRSVRNEIDEFLHIVVKHKNQKTNEVVYLEHNTRVEKRKEDGSISIIGGYVLDISNHIIMEKKNEELLRAYKLAVQSGKILIWYIDNDSIKEGYFFGNKLYESKLGLKKHSNGFYKISEFNKTIYRDDPEGENYAKRYFELVEEVNTSLNSFEKVILKHQNQITKEFFYLEHTFQNEKRNEDGSLLVRGGYITDVTDTYKFQKQNEYLLKYDAMTDLLNRNSFEKYISSNLLPEEYSLILVDIDGLKFINDAYGHLMGDTVIATIAKVLKEQFDDSASIFRIGGDEYAVISSELNYDDLEEKILQMKVRLNEFYVTHSINITISYGIEVVSKGTEFSEAFIDAENVMYRRKLNERSSRKSRIMETVLETLNQKTEETKDHCSRMGEFAVKLMKKSGYSRARDFEDMILLCKVHDIGKITVSEDILSKPGSLTREEYFKIRKHSEAGYKIIRNIVDSDEIAYGVLYHHERIDGKGYPFGLTGDEIPKYSKILSICDAYDVMISGRPYSKPKNMDEVIKELKAHAGTQFDKELVNYFIEILKEEKQ